MDQSRPVVELGERTLRLARRRLDRLAAPVAVLTVHHDGSPHGTTVGTLTRVSHRPLMVAAALKEGSQLVRAATAEGRFAVNVLAGEQDAVARRFACPDRPRGAEQFAALGWRPDPYSGAPLLDGALAHYACRLAGLHVLGDHEVLLGRVVRVSRGEGGGPLLSYRGGLYAAALRRTAGAEPTP